MSDVTYRRCDQCNKERRPHLVRGWWRLQIPEIDDDIRDFCTVACLESWVIGRQLGVSFHQSPVKKWPVRVTHMFEAGGIIFGGDI